MFGGLEVVINKCLESQRLGFVDFGRKGLVSAFRDPIPLLGEASRYITLGLVHDPLSITPELLASLRQDQS